MIRMILTFFILFIAGCETEEAPPIQDGGLQREACVTGEAGTLCAIAFKAAAGVSEERLEELFNAGYSERQLEGMGLLEIITPAEPIIPATARIDITNNTNLHLNVSAHSSVNVHYFPAASTCFNIWYNTNGSSMHLNMYWEKNGCAWVHWRTVFPMAQNVIQHTGSVWSNADNSPGAAHYRIKFSNDQGRTKWADLDIEPLGGDIDCMNFP